MQSVFPIVVDPCGHTLLPKLKDLYDPTFSAQLSDLQLICDGGQVVHTFKVLLAALSPMLESVLDDSDSDCINMIGIDAEAINSLHSCLFNAQHCTADQLNAAINVLEHIGVDLAPFTTCTNENEKVQKSPPPPKVMRSKKNTYTCAECNKEYVSELCFKNHLRLHEQEMETFLKIKKKEGEKVTTLNQQGRPVRQVNRPKRYTVDRGMLADDDDFLEDSIMEQLTSSSSGMKISSTRRKSERFYSCPNCNKCFSSKQSLDNHVKLHMNDRSFGCDKCEKKFVTKAALQAHSKTHDGSAHTMACQHCDKLFNNASNVQRHIRAVHFEQSDKRCFTCPECKKEFKDPSALVAHRKIHTGHKPFECEHCHKRFLTAAQLKVHKRIHDGERPYACKECGKSFTTNGQLKSHTLHKHIGVKLPKNNLCPECGAAFVKGYDLKVHMMKHTGETPHMCDFCYKGFRSFRNLRNHRLTHTGEKPYKCDTCGKQFRTPGAVRHHFKGHEVCRQNAQRGAFSIKQKPSSATTNSETNNVLLATAKPGEEPLFVNEAGEHCIRLQDQAGGGQVVRTAEGGEIVQEATVSVVEYFEEPEHQTIILQHPQSS